MLVTRPFILAGPEKYQFDKKKKQKAWRKKASNVDMIAAHDGELARMKGDNPHYYHPFAAWTDGTCVDDKRKKYETLRAKSFVKAKGDPGFGDCIITPKPGEDQREVELRKPGGRGRRNDGFTMTDVISYLGPFELNKKGTFEDDAHWSHPPRSKVWKTVKPLVRAAVVKPPRNGCIFAYGGSGSGKTYTMGGYTSVRCCFLSLPPLPSLFVELTKCCVSTFLLIPSPTPMQKEMEKDKEKHAAKLAAGETDVDDFDEYMAKKKIQEDEEVMYSTASYLLTQIDEERELFTRKSPSHTLELTLRLRIADNYKDTINDMTTFAHGKPIPKGPLMKKFGTSVFTRLDPQGFQALPINTKLDFWKAFTKAQVKRRTTAATHSASSRSHFGACHFPLSESLPSLTLTHMLTSPSPLQPSSLK